MPAPRRLAAFLTIALAAAAPAVAVAQETPPATDAPAAAAPPPADASQATTIEQIQLTPELVEKFVSSWPAMEALGDELAGAYGVDPSATDPTSAFKAWNARPEASTKITAAVTAAGFAGLADWVKVANSVVLAYGYDETQLAPERLAEVIAEIEASPDIPADQKPAVVAQVRQQFADAANLKPLAGNPEVVQPFVDRLAKMFGDSPVEGEMPQLEDEGAPPAEAAPPAAPAQ